MSLQEYPNQEIIEGALWSQPGAIKEFNLSSNHFASSSFLQMGLHKVAFPEVSEISKLTLFTTILDEIPQIEKLQDITLLVLDIQGAELEALKGATKTLAKLKYIYTEVSILPLYKNQATFEDIRSFLEPNGFALLEVEIRQNTGHGNAFFGKSKKPNKAAMDLANMSVINMEFSITRRVTSYFAHSLFKLRRTLNNFGVPIYLMRRPKRLRRKLEQKTN